MEQKLDCVIYRVDEIINDTRRLLLVTDSKDVADALLNKRMTGRAIKNLLLAKGISNLSILELTDSSYNHPFVSQALSLLQITQEMIETAVQEIHDFQVHAGRFQAVVE